MPADMAAISFGPNIIIGSFALIANVSLCTSQANTVFNTQPNREQSSIGLGYPCDQKCKKLSETTIAFSNVKLLPRPSRHEDIRSAWVHSEPWRMHAGAPRHCRKNAGELPRTAPASDLPHRHAMANAECHARGADRQAQSRGGSHSTYPSVGGGARSIASSSCEHRCCESCDSRARCDDRSAAPSTGRSPSCVQSRSRSPAPSRARPCSERTTRAWIHATRRRSDAF
jgi:hypothetical protein